MGNIEKILMMFIMSFTTLNTYAYRWQSPYAYCNNNPVNNIDPDGQKVIFVNGYLGFGSPIGGPTYWNGSNSSFVKGAQYAFKDYGKGWETENALFLNAWEPTQIERKVENTRIDATCTNDPVQVLSTPVFGEPDIPSSDEQIRIRSGESIQYIHRDLIDGNSNELWQLINELLSR